MSRLVLYCFLSIALLAFIPGSWCFNALLVSTGHAGHVTPLFELAKALHKHNVTLLTQRLAQSYIDFKPYSNSSNFRVIYWNDTDEAFIRDKHNEQLIMANAVNHSLIDGLGVVQQFLLDDQVALLTKAVDLLTHNQFDMIISNSVVKGTNALCRIAKIACVVQSTEFSPMMLDFNVPNIFSSLSRKHMTQIHYRLYNVIFGVRLVTKLLTTMLPSLRIVAQRLPRIPGPYEDAFSIMSMVSPDSRCLELISIPPTFYTVSHSHHYTKHLGTFIDETVVDPVESELTTWLRARAANSTIYGAFGTSSLVPVERMKNLLEGLAAFLLQSTDRFLVLVLRGNNTANYQTALNSMKNEEYRRILTDTERVRMEYRFVPQKWILRQTSIKLFLSHCGMGSCSEGIYFAKPILCMPFNMDQFINGMAIEQAGMGGSLFTPPSLWQSLRNPHNYQHYVFTPSIVTERLSAIWNDDGYQRAADRMSAGTKHAGGVRRAVEEIEYFVRMNGDLDRYAPFQSTLPFYQRYKLDLWLVFVILPILSVRYVLSRCRRGNCKEKTE